MLVVAGVADVAVVAEVVACGAEVVVRGAEVVVWGAEVVVRGAEVAVCGAEVAVCGAEVVVCGAVVVCVAGAMVGAAVAPGAVAAAGAATGTDVAVFAGGENAPCANSTASSSGIRPTAGASHHQRQDRPGKPRPERTTCVRCGRGGEYGPGT